MAPAARQDRQQDKRRRLVIWSGTAALMALPVLAIRAAERTPSDPGDYIFLALLLTGVGLAYELAARVPDRSTYLAACGAAAAAALLSVWINLAVGIIGSEDNPANLIYASVIVVALGGVFLARLEPRAMARAMTAAATAQLLAFVIALSAGHGFTGPITVFFTALWLIAAWLFRSSAHPTSAL
jgi:hypothetical protein